MLLIKQLDRGKREAEREMKRLEREMVKERLHSVSTDATVFIINFFFFWRGSAWLI